MIDGIIYGCVLNDRLERAARAADFRSAPYQKEPAAPVLYIKPRTCIVGSSASVDLPAGEGEFSAAGTLGLLFGSEPNVPVAVALALDISERHESYYRPAIRQRCRDGFLPLGAFSVPLSFDAPLEFSTSIDGRVAHRWSTERLVREPPQLVRDVAAFMTLSDGDLLLIGLPGDPPVVRSGMTVTLTAAGLAALYVSFVTETIS